MTTQAKAFAAHDTHGHFAPFSFARRDLQPDDVAIDILFCGICHSDLHASRSEWGPVEYPYVPGHEIVGRVKGVGDQVTKYKIGDLVGVGCMVDSCGVCPSCQESEEQYCTGTGFVGTYGGKEKYLGTQTYGGYSDHIVVKESFVLKINHDERDLAAVAPLLCAGITLYSPLHHWHAGPGKKVGVVGLGGLGHMGVKIAAAMGAEVTVFTTSPNKHDDAIRLGASHVVVSKDADQMAAQAGSFDLIVDTVAASHDLDPFLAALKRDGTLVLIGVPENPHPSPSVTNLIFGRRALAGSLIGGIKETQEMLDFCHQHGLTADVEVIPAQKIDEAYERMLKSDVKYRFSIDMASLKAA